MILINILNQSNKFTCNIQVKLIADMFDPSNFNASEKNMKFLTTNSIVKTFNVVECPPKTLAANGISVPCTPVVAPNTWINPGPTFKVNNFPVLTDKSSVICTIGGGIIMPRPPLINIAKYNALVSVAINPLNSITFNKSDNDNASNSNPSSSSKVVTSNNTQTSIDNSVSPKIDENIQNQQQNDDDDTPNKDYIICDYKNCKERDDCEYYNSDLSIDNNSAKLKRNFSQNRANDYNNYLSRHENANQILENTSFRKAAHHLISGNQSLGLRDTNGKLKYGNLLRLINYHEYDINNAFNCIMLPTNQNNFGELESVQKMASAFDVMSIIKAQWHVGGHQYQLDAHLLNTVEKYHAIHPPKYQTSAVFQCYREQLNDELDKILSKYQSSSCIKKRKLAHGKQFISELNSLSSKIESFLVDFENDPKYSYPFFVSASTVSYAYSLPKTNKIVFVFCSGGKTIAQKIRLERYKKDDFNIVVNSLGEIVISNSNDFILFCENIQQFYIDINTNYKLPFSSIGDVEADVFSVNYNNNGSTEFITSMKSEIMANVTNNTKNYQSPCKCVKVRLKGCV